MTTRISRTNLLFLFIASATPRLIGAVWLPNAFGDAYAYTEQIYYMRRALLDGSFSLTNLFGFWLPLYQLVCAAVSTIIGTPFFVPKLVSALAGGALCVLMYVVTFTLTESRILSFVTTGIIAINPYHLLYSSAAMTDVTHAFLILLCVFCCMKHRWLIAALCAVAAELMRIESWTLVPILPLAHAIASRNGTGHTGQIGFWITRLRSTWSVYVSPVIVGVLLTAGPIFWLFVSWKATGSTWKYFEIRNNYIVETLSSSSWLAQFSPLRVAFDIVRLSYTSNPVVLYVCIGLALALGKSGEKSWKDITSVKANLTAGARNLLTTPHGLLLSFLLVHLCFLLLAYVTNNQPEIWPRYGLLFFTLGLPLVAKRLTVNPNQAIHTDKFFSIPGVANLRLQYATAAIFALQFCVQLVDVTRITVKADPHAVVAEFLHNQRRLDQTATVYCEDGAVRVMSGIPLEEFKDQYNSPADDDLFLESLRENQIRFLVYKNLPGSRLKNVIARIKAGKGGNGILLEEITPKPRRSVSENIIVYRIRDEEIARVSRKPRVLKGPRK